MLVVLAILGLIMALGAPALERALPGLQLKRDAQAVASAMRQARSLAIGQNAEVALTIDLDRRAVRVGDAPWRPLEPGLGIALVTARNEVLGAGAGRIRFYPDGTSSGGRVDLSLHDRSYHVAVDWLTGRVALSP
jgi:general secretion pathway protein H